MAANTILLDFSLDPKKVKNEPQLSVIAVNIENVLRNYLDNLKLISTFSLEKGLFRLYTSDFGSITSLRVFGSGLITINIEFYKSGKQEPVLTYEKSKALERDIANHVLGISCSSILPPIKRGPFSRYYTTAGERLLEFDIDRLVFEEHTPFQKVQILHSKSFGNMLILDNMQTTNPHGTTILKCLPVDSCALLLGRQEIYTA